MEFELDLNPKHTFPFSSHSMARVENQTRLHGVSTSRRAVARMVVTGNVDTSAW